LPSSLELKKYTAKESISYTAAKREFLIF